LILRTAGTNCDGETAHAFEQAGAASALLHINRLLENPRHLSDYQLLAIPGGFSYGDDIAAGRIFAAKLRHRLGAAMRDFVESGKPVIGICNGFQVLLQTDLLPGPLDGRTERLCTLTSNCSGRFIDRWVHLESKSRKCIWTATIADSVIELPIAHGEGRFLVKDDGARRALWSGDHVALIYAKSDALPVDADFSCNPNGSMDDIAGVCDGSGLVLGLMPHPERHVTALQHPGWSSRKVVDSEPAGLQMFVSAVRYAEQSVGSGV